MKRLLLVFCMFGQVTFALPPQMVVPNEQEVLAAYSNDKEVVRAVSGLHEQGFSPVDTSVVSVSEGIFLISTYLERRAQPKTEPQNLIAVVVYRKGASVVRLLKAEAVRMALLTLASESL